MGKCPAESSELYTLLTSVNRTREWMATRQPCTKVAPAARLTGQSGWVRGESEEPTQITHYFYAACC